MPDKQRGSRGLKGWDVLQDLQRSEVIRGQERLDLLSRLLDTVDGGVVNRDVRSGVLAYERPQGAGFTGVRGYLADELRLQLHLGVDERLEVRHLLRELALLLDHGLER